jgi:hypothetical protein
MIRNTDKLRDDDVRQTTLEEAPVVQPVNPPRDPGAKTTPADSEVGNGLERTEESLREAEEQGRAARPRRDATEVPVFDRGDLPPKV